MFDCTQNSAKGFAFMCLRKKKMKPTKPGINFFSVLCYMQDLRITLGAVDHLITDITEDGGTTPFSQLILKIKASF